MRDYAKNRQARERQARRERAKVIQQNYKDQGWHFITLEAATAFEAYQRESKTYEDALQTQSKTLSFHDSDTAPIPVASEHINNLLIDESEYQAKMEDKEDDFSSYESLNLIELDSNK